MEFRYVIPSNIYDPSLWFKAARKTIMVSWGLGWAGEGGHKHFCHISVGVEYVFPTGWGGGVVKIFATQKCNCPPPPRLVINDSSLSICIILSMQRKTKVLIRLRGSAPLLFAYGKKKPKHTHIHIHTHTEVFSWRGSINVLIKALIKLPLINIRTDTWILIYGTHILYSRLICRYFLQLNYPKFIKFPLEGVILWILYEKKIYCTKCIAWITSGIEHAQRISQGICGKSNSRLFCFAVHTNMPHCEWGAFNLAYSQFS